MPKLTLNIDHPGAALEHLQNTRADKAFKRLGRPPGRKALTEVTCGRCDKVRYYEQNSAARLKTKFCRNCRRTDDIRLVELKRLIADGTFTKLGQAGAYFGVTRERIRQIVQREGLVLNQQWTHRFTWPCPLCGGDVTMKLTEIKKIRSPRGVYCKACRPRICLGPEGHIDPPRSKRQDHTCLSCQNKKRQQIVRWRHCIDCGKLLPVTWNSEHVAKVLGTKLERCQQCQGRRALSFSAATKRKGFCQRGHDLSITRYVSPKGSSRCMECIHLRDTNPAEFNATRKHRRVTRPDGSWKMEKVNNAE